MKHIHQILVSLASMGLLLLCHPVSGAVVTEPVQGYPLSFVDRSITVTQNNYAFAAIKTDGTVIAWGDQRNGALIPTSVAPYLSGTIPASKIYSGASGFAVVRLDGSVVSWGKCGVITPDQNPEIDGTIKVKSVSSSYNGFSAIREDGSVFFWGSLYNDNCASNTFGLISTLNGSIPAVSVSVNLSAQAAIRIDGSVVVWNTLNDSSVVNFANGLAAVQIYANQDNFAALLSDGSVARVSGVDAPAPIGTLGDSSPVVHISSNNFAHAAISADGSVFSWGDYWSGGYTLDSLKTNSQPGVVQITPTYTSLAALKGDGSVLQWGGVGGDKPMPGSMSNVKRIFSNYDAYAALAQNGQLYTWGAAATGADTGDEADPTSAAAFLKAKAIKNVIPGSITMAALAEDGTVMSWGGGGDHPFWSGNKEYFKASFSAVRDQLTNVVDVMSNFGDFVALKSDGSFVTWGLIADANAYFVPPPQPQTGILKFADYRVGESVFLAGTSGSDQISLEGKGGVAAGFAGADTVTGGTQSDYILGGAGNDLLNGGNGDDIVLGQEGSDDLYGDDGNDILSGDSTPSATLPSDDTLVGGRGNDKLNGGPGFDTAAYVGELSSYEITYNWVSGAFTVLDNVSGRDGYDTVQNVEYFQFADGTISASNLAVLVGSQTITWGQILAGSVGDSITLTATGGASGNAVTYAGTTGICTVSGSSLNLIGAGSCTVTASQAGNSNYNAATPVPKTFIVTNATVAISPASIAFPNQPINSTSAQTSLQISNTGTINLTVTGVNITAVAAADFAISNGCTTVAPSGSCTIAISFRPTTLGVKSASVVITSNASNSPTTVPLSGTGVAAAPIITLSPSALAFSNQLVGTTSATQALAIQNTGSAPMTISSLVLSGPNATAFVRTGNCTRVAVNATCTTSLSFRPTAAGPASATLTINSNAYQTAATQVPLSGTGIVTTISQLAGNIDGPGFVNGTGTAARFNGPSGVAVDASGNVFVADNNNHVIRRITAAGAVTTLAGTPLQFGATNGTGAAARFNRPFGIANNGTTLTVADTGNHTIRRVTSAGAVTTLAGTAGAVGSTNGTGATARFSSPQGVVIDSTGVAFVADTGNSTIRRITSTGVTTTFAGTAGQPGNVDGIGAIARFSSPAGIARDNANILYVTDVAGQIIRRITTTGMVTTVAGTAQTAGTVDGTGVAAAFSSPTGAVVDATGNIFVADAGNGTVRKITPAGVVTTFAGTAGSQGSADGTGAAAMFYRPTGLARDAANNLYMADPVAHTIRRITPAGVVSTFAGFSAVVGANDNAGSLASFRGPTGIVSDAAGNLYVADTANHTIRRITPDGVVTTFAGAAQAAGSADGVGTTARFSNPTGLAIDATGNVYVADAGNHLIRRIAPDGTVTTVAGGAGLVGAVDGIGASARFRSPSGLAVTGSGLLYVADTGNFTIRLITLSTGQVATLAGSAGFTGTTNGTGATARFGLVYGLATDSAGNVFAADFTASTIRRITPAGAVTLFAGTANARGTTNGTGTAARFSSPYALTIDATNTIYVADYGNCMLRKITSAAAVTTAVGTAGTCRFTAGNAPGAVNTPMGVTKQGTTVHFTAGNGVGRIVNMP